MKMLSTVKDKVLSASVSFDAMRGIASKRIVKAALGLPLLIAGKDAAAADTVWEMINVSTEGLSGTQAGWINAFRTIGVVLVGVGVWKWKEKNKENSRVEGKTVFGFILAGAMLVALGQFISVSAKSVGIDANVDG
ncbi:DUF6750 family protein [Erwinia sp. STN24]|jgi:hypothetical protein|uniref:DUF6750 family protein n=1 Tax=Erwinia sp. STN24 TaxID=3233996 RepID=UPI0035227585